MPNVDVEELEQNKLKLTITIPLEEAQPFLEKAAEQISQDTEIEGFRPGKAGYDVIKQRVGEMKIYETALEPLVRKTYMEALMNQNIDAVGSPKIDVDKLAPGNDIVYTAEIARAPKVTDLADYTSLSVEAEDIEVGDKDVENALRDLQRMKTREERDESGREAEQDDKVVLSVDMKKEGVPVEGGQSPNHTVFLNEDYYIPGFKDEVIGMTEGDEKNFTLTFPEDHAQDFLAGSDIEFDVTLKELYSLEQPELNDEFAKELGQSDLDALKDILRKNLEGEKRQEEQARQEQEMLELLAKKSKFEEIPDLLVNQEINKMINELKQRVQQQGVEFEDYLDNIDKSLADLKLDFSEQALTRVKVALVIDAVADKEGVEVTEEEIDEELDKMAERYDNEDAKKQIYSPQYRSYVENVQRNKKVVALLKEDMLEETEDQA